MAGVAAENEIAQIPKSRPISLPLAKPPVLSLLKACRLPPASAAPLLACDIELFCSQRRRLLTRGYALAGRDAMTHRPSLLVCGTQPLDPEKEDMAVPPFPHPPKPPRRFVSATVSRDPGGGGGGVTLGLSDSQRYDLRRFSDLSPNALAFSISSASVSRGAPHDSESSLYLFSGQTPVSNVDLRRLIPETLLNLRVQSPFVDFHGDFLRITLPPGAAGTSSVDDLTVAAFNDKATSVMLVDRWRNGIPEETVSAANTFTVGWDTAFVAIIPGVQFLLGGGVAISRIQDPVFSWIAFPPPNQALPTNYSYMLAAQWFVFHAWGIGMNAWLMFYLRLGRDGNGKVELNVVDMDYYVWPGTGQGQLMTALDGAKNGIMSALQTVSTLVLGNVSGTVCDDVYLLPGTQPNTKATANASAQGSALNDVTIILENPK